MITILVADDHAVVREGLKRILAQAPDMTVLAEACNGLEVMQRLRSTAVDLLLTDLAMPGRSGMELIRQARQELPGLRILVLSMHQESQYAVRSIRNGANGYLAKDSAPSLLLEAVRKVAGGGAYVSAEVAEQLAMAAMPGHAVTRSETLSNREFEIFRMVVQGTSLTDIALQLNLSSKTVSTHKHNLMQKLGVANQSDLVRYAIRHGLTDQFEP